MYEYKVLTALSARSSEKKFNELAKEGWRLVRTQLDVVGAIFAVFEREVKE